MRAFPTSPRISPRSTTPQPLRTTDDAATTTASEESANRSRHPLARAAVLAAAAAMVFSGGVAFAPSSGAAVTAPIAPEYAPARVGILEAVAAQPDPALIPDDFATQAGYRPVVEAGMLINPHGDCSSPVPLPAEFELACKSHDLGYDLLRYAAAHGEPLGPWARQTVDAALERRMHAACTDRAGALSRAQCDVMASVATTAVDLNSIRQDYGDPIYEPFFEPSSHAPSEATMLLGGVGLAFVSATVATVLVRRRRAAGHAPSTRAGQATMPIAAVSE